MRHRRRSHVAEPDEDDGGAAEESCALCGRPFGNEREKHHLIPRLKGGKETIDLHPICHRKIHSLFTEAELARRYNTISTLKAHPDIAAFVNWLAGKPPDFYKRTTKKLHVRR